MNNIITIKKYDKYKDSGIEWIGEIPQDWNIYKIKNLAEISGRIGFKGYTIDDLVDSDTIGAAIVLGGTNIMKEGYISYNKLTYISEYKYLESPEIMLYGGEILITKVGAGTGDNAIYNYYTERVTINPNVMLCKPNNNIINSNYLNYYLLSPLTKTEILIEANKSGAQPAINQQYIKNLFITCPPELEQQQIAVYLDKKCGEIDRVVEIQKDIIEKLKEYKQSVITEAVTKGLDKSVPLKDSGVEWISKIPQYWDIIRLKYKFRIKKEIAGREGFDILSVTQKGLKIKDISSNEGQLAMDYSKYQLVNPSDFVMNHMDLLTGWVDCSIYNGVTSPDYRVFVNTDLQCCNNEYYKNIFQTCYRNKIFFGIGQGVSDLGRWRLQSDKFLNFYIPIPPYQEQLEINEFILKKCSEIDSTIFDKEQLIEKLTEYKKSLIYECVTGKRKVVL